MPVTKYLPRSSRGAVRSYFIFVSGRILKLSFRGCFDTVVTESICPVFFLLLDKHPANIVIANRIDSITKESFL
jgi:hypothetical protein